MALGSGSRPKPLSMLATNRFYMIRQDAVFGPPTSYTRLTASDLYDATANTLATATGSALESERVLLNEARGWYFDLPDAGEKVLASPLIARGKIVFTTYVPGSSGAWCRPAAGTAYEYIVGLEDAVRTEPRPLLSESIPDTPTISVLAADPNEPPYDGNDPGDPNDPDGGDVCPNGNRIVIKLNAEDGPIDDWCNDASKTYWIRDQ